MSCTTTSVAGNANSFGPGTDGVGTSASFSTPLTLTLTPFGDLFVGDGGGEANGDSQDVRYVRTGMGALGSVSTLPGGLRAFSIAQSRTTGVIYLGADCFISSSPSGNPVFTLAAGGPSVANRVCGAVDGLAGPQRLGVVAGMAYAEATATLYFTDFTANLIRMLTTSTGEVRTLAGAIQLANAVVPYPAPVFTAPGPPVTASLGAVDDVGTAARLAGPWGLSLDPTSQGASTTRLIFTDSYNNLVRVLTLPSGAVTTLAGNVTLAASSGRPTGIATLTQGFADGAGASASFTEPLGLAVLPSGYTLVADPSQGLGAGLLRLVSPGGVVSTLLGQRNPPSGNPTDGNSSTAILGEPAAVVYDAGRGTVWLLDGVGLVSNVSCKGLPMPPSPSPAPPPSPSPGGGGGGAAAAAATSPDFTPVSIAATAALGALALVAILVAVYFARAMGRLGSTSAGKPKGKGGREAQQEMTPLGQGAVVVTPPKGIELWAKGAGGAP